MVKFTPFKPREYLDISEQCWISFQCPKCHEFLTADSHDDISICSCGSKYTVSAVLFHVKEPKEILH